MKEHQISEVVNQLRDIALQYRDTQQLRERIAHVVVPLLGQLVKQTNPKPEKVVPVCPKTGRPHHTYEYCDSYTGSGSKGSFICYDCNAQFHGDPNV